jgi:hypothetical protein
MILMTCMIDVSYVAMLMLMSAMSQAFVTSFSGRLLFLRLSVWFSVVSWKK